MILGFDWDLLRPFISIGFSMMFIVFCWLAYRHIKRVATNVIAMSEQFGSTTNGSTLRSELTAISKRIDDLKTLAEREVAIRNDEIEKLQGLVTILQETMGKMGLETQVRMLFETYGKKEVANTVSIVQAGTGAKLDQVAAGAGIEQAQHGINETQKGIDKIQNEGG